MPALAPCIMLDLRPDTAKRDIKRVDRLDNEALHMGMQSSYALRTPVLIQRPELQLSNSHKGDDQKLTGKMRSVEIGFCRAFEEI